MIDWTGSMSQTFEYYKVDPTTWKDSEKLDCITSSSIDWDSEAETLGSAQISVTKIIGECYIRIYLIATQNGVEYKEPLGTFLVQTPSSKFDGKVTTASLDAYTPLIELKECPPPLGYTILKEANIMKNAYLVTKEHLRAPVVQAISEDTLSSDFVASTSDTWMSFLSDLIANAKYSFELDEMGRVLFTPDQDTVSLQPVRTFDDSNSSILYPEVEVEHDIYGIPNVIEVVYSGDSGYFYSRAENNDPNSPVSISSRGREIIYRETSPSLSGNPTQAMVNEYAEQLLRNSSSLEYSITLYHGYCGTRVGDCIRLDYASAGLTDIKAKIISQSIDCTPGCKVTEKAVYTKSLLE